MRQIAEFCASAQGRCMALGTGLAVLFIALLTSAPEHQAGPPATKDVAKPARRVGILRAGQYSVDKRIKASKASVAVLEGNAKPTINFNVTFNGFTEEAKKAFQGAVDVWGGLLVSNVTVRIDATFEVLGPN